MQHPNMLGSPERIQKLKQETLHLPSWDLTIRQQCDLELLLNGGFAPLKGFMDSKDYARVVKDMRLADGTLWPIPIVLDVPTAFVNNVSHGQRIVLRDQEGVALAILTVCDSWTPDKKQEATSVYGTTDTIHPGVAALFNDTHDVYLGGEVAQWRQYFYFIASLEVLVEPGRHFASRGYFYSHHQVGVGRGAA